MRATPGRGRKIVDDRAQLQRAPRSDSSSSRSIVQRGRSRPRPGLSVRAIAPRRRRGPPQRDDRTCSSGVRGGGPSASGQREVEEVEAEEVGVAAGGAILWAVPVAAQDRKNARGSQSESDELRPASLCAGPGPTYGEFRGRRGGSLAHRANAKLKKLKRLK